MTACGPSVRNAGPEDAELLLGFVRELATFERAPGEVAATSEDLRRALEGPAPATHALLAEHAGRPVGAAIYYLTFSTWTGRQGIHLEDLFVEPGARRLGVGRALLEALASECRANGYARLEWDVLDWNVDALSFYESFGAQRMAEWVSYRLAGASLDALGVTTER
jgi:GNAT superfamily N-acetyltransferase